MKHNWEYRRLGDIAPAKPFKGTITSADGRYWCLNLDKIESNTGVVLEYDFIEETELGGSVHKFTVNNVLFSKLRPNLNKVVVPEQNGYCTTELVPLHPLDILNRYYLAYYLRSPKYVNFLIGKTGGAKMPRVKMDIFWNSTIPVPPMETQEQIVAELDQINDLIAKNRELLSQLDALAQSLFYDTFGDPSVNPKSFPLCALSDICDAISTGITYKPEMVAEDGTIVLRSSNIQESTFVLDDIVRVQMQLKESQYVKKNDILMCSRNGSARLVGKVCLIPDLNEKMSWGAFMTIIRSKHFRFLFHYFRLPAFREQLKKTKTSTVNQITIGMLKSIKLPFPPLALQEDFAAKVEAIEAQKAKVEAEIAELQTLLDARMDYWFN